MSCHVAAVTSSTLSWRATVARDSASRRIVFPGPPIAAVKSHTPREAHRRGGATMQAGSIVLDYAGRH